MVRIELAPEIFDDIDRFMDHMIQHEVASVQDRVGEIFQALEILTHSPLIGRPVENGKRELIIGKGSSGYIALYRYLADIDTIFVLALRAQREFGFKH